MRENKKNLEGLKYIHFAISFGSTTVVSLYLGYRGGQFLDNQYSLYPTFTLLGIILGIIISFKRVIDDLKHINKPYGERLKAKYGVKASNEEESENSRKSNN